MTKGSHFSARMVNEHQSLDGLPGRCTSSIAAIHGRQVSPVFACDRSARVSYLNTAAKERWGEAVAGQPCATLFTAAMHAPSPEQLALVLRGEAFSLETGERAPGGVRNWAQHTFEPLYDADVIVGFLCQVVDVTTLKVSEIRLRRSEQLMVDTQGVAHLGTWEWDVSLPTAVWSDELYRIYGLTKDTYTPSYDRYLTLVHPDDRQRVIDATNRVFHEHVPYSHDERIFRPDGSLRHLHTWAHPLLDEHGKLTHLIGVCQDITERVLAEDAVRALNQDLERRVDERTKTIETSMRDLEAFNAMISHDLRAPLMTIQLSVDQLQSTERSLTPDAATDRLRRIKRAATRAAELLNDLLSLARVGVKPMEKTRVDLSHLGMEVAAALVKACPSRNVEIAIAPGLSCRAVPGLLRAAMENLLGNAWKYTSKTERARIELGAMGGSERFVFFVRDNGAGFDPAGAERLFRPFERLHTADDFEGTGVGLAVVHRIVERHGGQIWAEATPGHGATFFVALPD